MVGFYNSFVTAFIFLIAYDLCTGQQRATVETLYSTLLLSNSSFYYKHVRPDGDQSVPTAVQTDLFITSLRDLDEMTGRFTVVAFLTIQWTDERIVWDPTDYESMSEIELPQSEVWRPEVTLANPFVYLKQVGNDDNLIRYTSTGNASWMIGDVMQATCDVDVTHYPFDKQKCSLYFFVWGYSNTDVSLTPSDNGVNFTYYASNAEWDIIKTEQEQVLNTSPYIRYVFHMQRKSTFFIINIYIPVLLLTALCTLVFLLPADSGERVGYSITCLLSVAVFLTVVSESLPRSSSPVSVLGFFLMCDFVLATCLCILTIIGLKIYHKDEDDEIPKWLQKIVSFCCCINSEAEASSNNNSVVEIEDTSSEEKTVISRKKELQVVTWKHVAKAFDFTCLFVSNGACVVLMAVYLMYTNIV